MRVPTAPHSYQHLVLSVFSNFDHSRRYIAVSRCFNVHFPNDICCGDLLICLLAIGLSSLERDLLRSLAYFKIRLFVFLLLSLKSSLYNLNNSSFQVCLVQIFSHKSVACLLILST